MPSGWGRKMLSMVGIYLYSLVAILHCMNINGCPHLHSKLTNSIVQLTIQPAGCTICIQKSSVETDSNILRLHSVCLHESTLQVPTHLNTFWSTMKRYNVNIYVRLTHSSNYRPISLTPVVMEHVLHSIMQHVQENGILSYFQHGFNLGYSCQAQLIDFIENIQYSIDHQKKVDLILSYIAIYTFSYKAFDTVPHQCLLTKLASTLWNSR